MTDKKEAGEKSNAFCHACKGLVETTYQVRNVTFDDDSGSVSDLLVGVCDQCDRVITVPAQSLPAIRDKLKLQRMLDLVAGIEVDLEEELDPKDD